MYWVAQIDGRREELAVHYLQEIANYEVYAPHVRAQGGRRVVPLFPGYLFLAVAARGWWAARWSPGVRCLVLSGEEPARISDAVVAELRGREGRDGLIRLPPPRGLSGAAQFQRGDKVKVRSGPMSGFPALVETMQPHQLVEVLLQMPGSLQRVELAAADVEARVV